MRSPILIIISYILLYKILIKSLLEDYEKLKNQ